MLPPRCRAIRTTLVAVVATLVLTTAGCATRESATTATPAPQPSVAATTPVPASPSPTVETTLETEPTPEPEATPDSEPQRLPAIEPQPVSRFVAATPSPSTTPSTASTSSSARRNPPPLGSVDCSTSKCIALTFDDGPGPHTSRLVGMLASKGARATFFMQGVALRANPGIARRVADSGMEVGNHSATHPKLNQVGAAQLRREIVGTHASIKEITGREATVFRPPYGARNAAVDAMAADAGESVILWDVDTQDWRTRSTSATRQSVAQQARSGSIVLMHDIHGSTVDAVPGIIDDLQGQGYVLVTVSELLGGSTPGRVYTRR